MICCSSAWVTCLPCVGGWDTVPAYLGYFARYEEEGSFFRDEANNNRIIINVMRSYR